MKNLQQRIYSNEQTVCHELKECTTTLQMAKESKENKLHQNIQWQWVDVIGWTVAVEQNEVLLSSAHI